MGDNDEETERLAKILDHPTRTRIIQLLGQSGPLGWKELSADVGVKTGALYHHLDALEGIVSRDINKKYILTKAGQTVYSRLSEAPTIEAVHRAARDLREAGRGRRFLASLFTPRSLLDFLSSTRRRAGASLVVFASGFLIISLAVGVYPTLYFFQDAEYPLLSVLGFAASLGALVGVCFASTKAMKSEADLMPMAAATAVSFLPVVAYTLLTEAPAFPVLATMRIPYTIGLVFFQTWSATILGAGISVASGIRIERALLVSLGVLYATMVLVFLQGKIV